MTWRDLGSDSACVTSGRLLSISGPHFLYLQNEDDKAYLGRVATAEYHNARAPARELCSEGLPIPSRLPLEARSLPVLTPGLKVDGAIHPRPCGSDGEPAAHRSSFRLTAPSVEGGGTR